MTDAHDAILKRWREMLPEAVAIGRLMVDVFPESANAHDTMGEMCMHAGDKLSAIEHYRKSLKLNPENANAVTMLEELRGN